MDSMRNLNRTLPKTQQQDIHQAFRTAALTVTTLYRSAIADLDKARAEGYQEAMEELLGFLDRENLGVGDGEGWRVRQWATERYQAHAETSDDDTDDKRTGRSSSPVLERTAIPQPAALPVHGESSVSTASEGRMTTEIPPMRPESAPAPLPTEQLQDTEMAPTPPMFHFTASHPYPSFDATTDNTLTDPVEAARRAFPGPYRRPTHRSQRNMQRDAARNSQNNTIPLGVLGTGAGTKRKLMENYFGLDFGGNDHRKDGHGGGGKRGRMS